MVVNRITFYVNSDKAGAEDEKDRLQLFAKGLGMVCSDENPEVVVVLGGDGTMLSAVHRYPGIPLIGLNLGS